MLEGSGRVVRLALSLFSSGGLDVPQLTSGLRLGRAVDDGLFADWNELAHLFGRAEEAAGGPARLQALCEGTIRDALPEAVGAMQLAPDLVSGTHLINTYADAVFFANVRYPTMKRMGERRLSLQLRIAQHEGHNGCRPFFEAMQGVLRAASVFAGLAPATVSARTTPYRGDYEIVLPVLHHQPLDGVESGVRQALFSSWESRLRALRPTVQALRAAEIRALESHTYAALSTAVSDALAAQELTAMPLAVVQAIREQLGCGRVVLRLVNDAAPSGVTLAACGTSTGRLTSFESQSHGGLLVILADVPSNSASASAMKRLAPWLAMVLGGVPPPPSPSGERARDWPAARLSQLARRWRLTPRQTEVAWLIVQGETNKAIASSLGCAERTVELHAHMVLSKARAGTRAALTSVFYRGD